MSYATFNKAERTKRYIVEKAAPVFNRQGYAATSLADLVAATGLTKGSIYGNFKNKDEVAVAAFQHNVGFIVKAVRERIERADTCLEKLLAYPRTYRAIAQSMISNGGCPVLNTAVDSSGINVALHRAVCKIISVWKNGIVAIIEKGMQNKEFSADVNATKTAEVLICLVEGGFAMTKTTGEVSYLENAIDQVERIIHSL